MEAVKTPNFKLTYNGKEIAEKIRKFVKKIEFTDNLHGQADEINIVLNDSTNIWKSDWYPEKSDTIEFELGYNDTKLVNCGKYEVDQISVSHENFIISGQSLFLTEKSAQQNDTKTYKDKTLQDIIKEIADKHKMKFVDKITPNMTFKHLTQNSSTDLSFLMMLADSFGYILKITGEKIVFYKEQELFNKKHTIELDLSDLIYYNITDKTDDIYSSCTVSRWDSQTNKIIKYTHEDTKVKSGSELKLQPGICENETMAKEIAKASLLKKNSEQISGTITVTGDSLIQAGVNIKLMGLHKLNGIYTVTRVKHVISHDNGYVTTAMIKRVREKE